MNKYIIYGDVGGTKTILQIAKVSNGDVLELFTHYYESPAFTSFSAVLRNFLDKSECEGIIDGPVFACFAVAGPVIAQQTKLTNLLWVINAADIKAEFSMFDVSLINDFEAAALAIETLSACDLVTLQTGQAYAEGMRVIIGAGTGMGVAWLTWRGDRYMPLSTEAGHIDFAPTSPLQIRLLEALQKKFGHVSVERLLSGPGLTNIFNFLQMDTASCSDLEQIKLDDDSGAIISTLAQRDKHAIAIKSLDLFAEIYGAYAGNMVLAGLCRSGVYIAGGIAPKLINILKAGGFMRAFHDKGRFSAMMKEIPVHVIMSPDICLRGAKRAAQYLIDT